MASTTFSGPVTSTNGFVGDTTGTLIQPVASVAASGTTIANAAAVTTGITLVSAGDGTKSVVLPTAAAGLQVMLYTTVASNGVPVLANTGDTINGGASVTMEGNTWLQAVAVNSTAWLTTIFTANS